MNLCSLISVLISLATVGGALVLALAGGLITDQMLKCVDNSQVEVLLTLALAMGRHGQVEGLAGRVGR